MNPPTAPVEKKNFFQEHETFSRFAFGGLACTSAALVTNPVDVLKVRLQLVGERTHHPAGTSATLNHATPHSTFSPPIALQEAGSGFGFLYKGLTPALLREGTYSTIRVGLYETFKHFLVTPDAQDKYLPLWKKIVAGGSAGAIGSAIANPTDLVKVRMQAKTGAVKYKSTLDAFIRIYRDEGGIRGLYRGVGPTTQRAILLTSSQLPSYDQSKQMLVGLGYRADSINTHFVASFMAGFVCSLVTSPMDLVKSRLMLQRDQHKYRGILDCAFQTVKYEGFLGLYRGFMMNWLRLGPHTIITFLIFEKLRHLAGIKPL
ncbi:mitochondrial carrier [Basidiobolus meristosporus CBS 931.73]|uniref:Mitochondrial carrier n=1 Tax=Basidiobolus meristosporus CBS 931.73 TaxID=1314790 RepID=A0A1Y1YQP2_9FUNG|nr:mitochondrial carrier [Basidiobolus meristosporus CBS 931.73]|eukprot:ORY00067.1 mitochondrial carrier [Basidiobolus meristosporus CBS 931.73]